jgi:very-short-patch-repair endonuclease
MTSNDFIKKAKEIHGNKYDYSKVEFVNTKTKVCIICPKHGEFWQIPYSHLKGFGCCKCGHERTNASKFSNSFDFIKKARKVHGDKYDYSKVDYSKSNEKICIICPEHGEFWQTPNKHLIGDGCPKCGHKNTWDKRGRITTEDFIERAKKVHGDKYDYSKVEYKGAKTKVCIICPIHGEFWQTPQLHLNGSGCWKCGFEKLSILKKYTTEDFIKKAKEIHGDRYDYSKVDYINSHTKVCIICPKHGEFWQSPNNHINGLGCCKCNQENKSMFEESVFDKLKKLGIKIERQKTFEWLKYRSNLFLDFYLPDYDVGIEVQGKQHYEPVDFFGGEETFLKQQKRDKKKFNLCEKHGIKIFYIKNKNKLNLDEVKKYINETAGKKK